MGAQEAPESATAKPGWQREHFAVLMQEKQLGMDCEQRMQVLRTRNDESRQERQTV
jgi:hypothetical protein